MPRRYVRHNPGYVLRYIKVFLETHGRSPSYGEIGKGCDISSKAQVSHVLKKLEQSGDITNTGRKHGIRVVERAGGE